MFTNIDQNTHDILFKHIGIEKDAQVIIVYDTEISLTEELKKSYEKHLIDPVLIDFPNTEEEVILEEIDKLRKGDLVILIQTGSFRMSKFRWRLELFHRGMKVIEHPRLGHNKPEEYQTYIDALTCDLEENTKKAEHISKVVSEAKEVTFTSQDGSEFSVQGPFEDMKPNLGVYEQGQNVGGGFPVGEVFTEPVNLNAFNGELSIRAYPSMEHKVVICEPFRVEVKDGFLSYPDSAPEEFKELMKLIETENEHGKIPMREMGLGLNKHISFDKALSETSAFERQQGLHFSLGMKHNIYRKKVPKTVNQKYHIDIYIDVKTMAADGEVFYDEGYAF